MNISIFIKAEPSHLRKKSTPKDTAHHTHQKHHTHQTPYTPNTPYTLYVPYTPYTL